MDVPFLTVLLFSLGFLWVIEGNKTHNVRVRSLSNAIFCGITRAPEVGEEPLRYSPWMVVLTTLNEKGRDNIVDCGVTLISNHHAITSHACLMKEGTKEFTAIMGAPSLQALDKGSRRRVNKISPLHNDNRIAVLSFAYLLFGVDIKPVCLGGYDIRGVYATVGWTEEWKKRNLSMAGKKVAFLRLQNYCQTDGFCAEVLPVESPWEMGKDEIQEGAPLLVQKNSLWYIIGVMIKMGKQREITNYNRKSADTDENLNDSVIIELQTKESDSNIFFVKLTSDVTDELKSMFGLLK